MYFTQTGGYVLPYALSDSAMTAALVDGRPGRTFINDLTAFVAPYCVRDVLAGPGTPQPLLKELTTLGWPERTVGDVRIFHVPRAVRSAATAQRNAASVHS